MGSLISIFQTLIGTLAFIIIYSLLLLLFTKGYYVQNTNFKKCFIVSSIVGGVYFVLALLQNLVVPQSLSLVYTIIVGLIIFVSMILLTKKKFDVSVKMGIGVSLLTVILLYVIGYLIGVLFGLVG